MALSIASVLGTEEQLTVNVSRWGLVNREPRSEPIPVEVRPTEIYFQLFGSGKGSHGFGQGTFQQAPAETLSILPYADSSTALDKLKEPSTAEDSER